MEKLMNNEQFNDYFKKIYKEEQLKLISERLNNLSESEQV